MPRHDLFGQRRMWDRSSFETPIEVTYISMVEFMLVSHVVPDAYLHCTTAGFLRDALAPPDRPR
jgi:hypothetical protein